MISGVPSVKIPFHCDQHNTPGYNTQPRWLSEVHPRPSPRPMQVPGGKVIIMLEPDPRATLRFSAHSPPPQSLTSYNPFCPGPTHVLELPAPALLKSHGGGYGLARSRRWRARALRHCPRGKTDATADATATVKSLRGRVFCSGLADRDRFRCCGAGPGRFFF